MFDLLVDHAIKNVWCTPRQDLQYIIQPARLSSFRGVIGSSPLLWGTIAMPTPKDRYHLFQLGQLHPSLMGLMPIKHVWEPLSKTMAAKNLIADVYTEAGLHFPRSESYVLVTTDRNVVLAVREQPTIAPVGMTPVYFRFYSNAYFASMRAQGTVNAIDCAFHRHVSVGDSLLFQHEYHLSQAKPGLTSCFVNGKYVHDFLPQALKSGDTIEFVYDSTVKKVADFPIRDLKVFDSILDQKRKYLLHYEGPQAGDTPTIDYRDDLDVYLIDKGGKNGKATWSGVYYHKNQNDALRQVTHRDYAVSVAYLNGYVNDYSEWNDVNDLTVRLCIREAGYDRPLVFEHHRIEELYKLKEEDLVKAMLGIDSNVEVWKAAQLENSPYVKVMDAKRRDITRRLVQEAYGYNAIAKLTGDTPSFVELVNGRRQISLPYSLRSYATMYEYDKDGVLLGSYYYPSGYEYTPVNPKCELVEGLVGRGSYQVSTTYGKRTQDYDSTLDHRFYVAPITVNGVDNTKWQDVTGDTSKYEITSDKKISWLVDQNLWAIAVKTNKDFLAYELTLSPRNGLLKFSIDETATYPASSAHGVAWIPVGRLDLWLNDRALIENLDYYVKWPQVIIVNKKYLKDGEAQKITVRGTGFCLSDMTRPKPKDHGFVEYGLLSRNRRFDLRDDRVQRFVVDGRTYDRSVLKFSESDSGLRMDNIPNGAPYLIDDIIVPMRDLVTPDTDTYQLRGESLTVDQAVSDYLTLKLPEPPETNPDDIVEKYPVYSPFSSTVMYDLLNGILDISDFEGQYSDRDVKEYLASYVYLLAYDPTQKKVDLDHVAIHPHNLNTVTTLNIYQYNFLNRAIHVFLKDRVDITRFIKLKDGWI